MGIPMARIPASTETRKKLEQLFSVKRDESGGGTVIRCVSRLGQPGLALLYGSFHRTQPT
jgi:hypothetical protein